MAVLPETTEQAAASPRNRDQERIVRHLAEHVRRELAGESHRYIERTWPHRKLQLGVLPPLPPPEDPPNDKAAADTSDDDEKAAVARVEPGRPPSTMAVEFLYVPDDGATLEVEADFCVYIQRYPTRDQQAEYWARTGGAATDLDGEPADGDTPIQAEPTDSADNGDATDGTDSAAGGDVGKRKSNRPPVMSLMRRFERIDIHVGPFTVALDAAQRFDQTDLRDDVQAVMERTLAPVLAARETVYMFQSGTQTLPESALDSDEAWWEAIRTAEGAARAKPLALHRATILVNQRRDRNGRLRIRVTLENESVAPRRRPRGHDDRELGRDMHLFNSSLLARRIDGFFHAIEFAQAPEDFRYDLLRRVWAHGSNAVAEGVDAFDKPVSLDVQPDAVRTTTWPIFRQRRLKTNPEYEIEFTELAGDGWRGALARVEQGMRQFLTEWNEELQQPEWVGGRRLECERDRDAFAEEIRRYSLGLRALDEDEHLARAFREANVTFERIGRSRDIRAWRLFQLVYQVMHCSALRARETDDPVFVSELDTADVLWFPTGGGKTEAYLGLIAIGLFYDRLRGKKLGVSAILRFPLRMLSVQQLSRVGTVVYVAEERRREIVATEQLMTGDTFGLGFYVGKNNTPNRLTGPKNWTTDSIVWWRDLIAGEPDEAHNRRVVTECLNPNCVGGEVSIEVDVDQVRLRHVCSQCGDLRVYFTDDEVFRYLPAVTVCTVDKLASVGFQPNVAHLISGPARKCPKHGYFTHFAAKFKSGKFVSNDRCLAGTYCNVDRKEYVSLSADEVKDPVPAIQVQDEMHLLQEELGAFDAHYETLYEHLQRAAVRDAKGNPIGKPTKLLAATATIERYEEQVRNLYARKAKVFPAPGWTLERSFYTTLSDDASRIYVGALPMLRDAAEFGGRVQSLLHAEVERLQDDPAHALELLQLESITDEQDLLDELFLYELSLGYVNRSRDGDVIQTELNDYERDYGLDRLKTQLLASDAVTLTEIADTLRLIEEQGLTVERAKRLRALIGTSIVSHGVDIDRLNLMVVNWIPAKIADYIQSSSRAGRTHVGLIILGHDRVSLREASHFHYFLPYHRFLERMVAPVPVNRFAKFAVERTLPGIVCALILQELGRTPPRPLIRRSEFVNWWNSAYNDGALEQLLTDYASDALGLTKRLLEPDGSFSRVYDQGMIDSLKADVELELKAIFADLKVPTAKELPQMLTRKPMTSFRDVDAPLLFGTMNMSSRALDRLRPTGESA
jgi:hypothetical protein